MHLKPWEQTNLHRSCRLSEQRGGEDGVTLNSDGFFQGEQISWNQWGLLHNTENALKTTELLTSNTGLKTCGSYPHRRRDSRSAPVLGGRHLCACVFLRNCVLVLHHCLCLRGKQALSPWPLRTSPHPANSKAFPHPAPQDPAATAADPADQRPRSPRSLASTRFNLSPVFRRKILSKPWNSYL